MPHRCCMPSCTGNYSNGPRFAVFSFPKTDELRKKWIKADHRKNFVITKAFEVCEFHFQAADIEKESIAYDEKSGKRIVVPLSRIRLRKNAVPPLLPGCPSYMSTEVHKREEPDFKRQRIENKQFELAIAKNLEE